MEIHQLRYFVAIAETGGFSRAARRCCVSQPSLSQQIMKLEDELGKKLFDRLGRSIAMTDAGKALLPRAKRILRDLQEARNAVDQEVDDETGQINIGIIPTMAPFLLQRSVAAFQKIHPEATISLSEDMTHRLIEQLVQAEIDVGIMSLPIDNNLIDYEELGSEILYLAVAKNGPLDAQPVVSIDSLADEPFIMLHEAHCLGDQIQNFCYSRKISPPVICKTAQISTVQGCVAKGLGVSMIPQMAAREDDSGLVAYKTIEGENPIRAIAAATHSGRAPSKLVRSYIECVQGVLDRIGTKDRLSA
ncbi:MAG: LysR family transcriptional regulator [Gemmatimonadetes bacterium]|nr:LysR family transcriptional regulator [Gemmatimonadota bacterium]